MTALRDVAIVVFFGWMCVDSMIVFRLMTGAAENRDRFSLKLLLIGSFLTLWFGIGLAFGALGALHSVVLQVAGMLVMGIGIAVRSTAIAQLGRFHSPNVSIRADHQLKETGLYALVRHPSYFGALLAYLGFSLAMDNWLSVVAIMSVTSCLYLYRIHEEDAALLAAFGEPYRAYCARTRRLIPWLY